MDCPEEYVALDRPFCREKIDLILDGEFACSYRHYKMHKELLQREDTRNDLLAKNLI